MDMGASKALRLLALGHPVGVVPVVVEVPDDGAGARRSLVMEAVGVGLVDAVHVEARTQMVLVDGAFAERRRRSTPRCRSGRAGVMGVESGFQPLKSPTTEMRSASGAQTAK